MQELDSVRSVHADLGRKIRKADLFIWRHVNGFRVDFHLNCGSSYCRSTTELRFDDSPVDWQLWGEWFRRFLGKTCGEALRELEQDANLRSDRRSMLLIQATAPYTREEKLFPATSFWTETSLLEDCDIYIRVAE